MQQQKKDEEKPARVRIENKMLHGLDVPLPGPGKSIRGVIRIPKATPQAPGVYEGSDFDAVTLNRLRYHYEWRPTDPKLFGKKKDELTVDQITEVGLLKITVLPEGKPADSTGKQPKAA